MQFIFEYSFEESVILPKNKISPIINCLKIFRIFRIFIFTEILESSAAFLMVMLITIKKISYFLIIILFFVGFCSLIGKELFAYRIKYLNDKPDMYFYFFIIYHFSSLMNYLIKIKRNGNFLRLNYNDFKNSLLSTTLIFFNEEWHFIMFNHIRIFGYKTCFFFVFVLIMGQIFFIKILLALFIEKFIKTAKSENLIEKKNFSSQIILAFRENFQKVGTFLLKRKSRFLTHHFPESSKFQNSSSLYGNYIFFHFENLKIH